MHEPTDGEAVDKEPLEPEVIASFKDFWTPIVMPAGVWDHDQVKRELHDYQLALDNVPQVYLHITGHRMSKAHYRAADVIAQHDECCEFKIDLDRVCALAEAVLEEPISERRADVRAFAIEILEAVGDLIVAPD